MALRSMPCQSRSDPSARRTARWRARASRWRRRRRPGCWPAGRAAAARSGQAGSDDVESRGRVTGQFEQQVALPVRDAQRLRERFHDLRGGRGRPALLQSGQIVVGDPSELGQLFAAQPGRTPSSPDRHAHRSRARRDRATDAPSCRTPRMHPYHSARQRSRCPGPSSPTKTWPLPRRLESAHTRCMKTVVMTGGTAGFGAVAAQRISDTPNTKLILGARDTKSVDALPLDLARLANVRSFVQSLTKKLDGTSIDVLILNAGAQFGIPSTGPRTDSNQRSRSITLPTIFCSGCSRPVSRRMRPS